MTARVTRHGSIIGRATTSSGVEANQPRAAPLVESGFNHDARLALAAQGVGGAVQLSTARRSVRLNRVGPR